MTLSPKADSKTFEDALKVARMYYHVGLSTTDIAKQLGVSRPTVSRLLSWAKSYGIVEFRILDHRVQQLSLETQLEREFEIADVKVVPVSPDWNDAERQQGVAAFAAHYLNSLMSPNTTVALAWGSTISLLADALIPKPLAGVTIAQMNGSGNSGQGLSYAAGIISRFADNYSAATQLLPIPAYFDEPTTKDAMFRERSIRQALGVAKKAQIVLFSIGVPDAYSYVYRAGYVEDTELAALREDGVVGDIATVFFREDGTYKDIFMNRRSSGPDLASLADHKHAICIVSGEKKLRGVRGALKGKFFNTLIIDEPSARALSSETQLA